MTKSEERELLQACFSGDRAAWERFVETYSKLVYYSIRQTLKVMEIAPDPDDLDDLYGNVFLSLFENNFARLKSFKGKNDCSLASWIRLIASRKTYDHLRERGRQARLLDSARETIYEPQANEDVEKSALDSERAESARNAISQLSADEIAFIHLYYERELPPERIAEMLGITVSTVYSKKNRVREKIRKIIKEKGGRL